MQHCCKFKADDIYFLTDTEIYTKRVLSMGFCPVCRKPVATLTLYRFDGVIEKYKVSGATANKMVADLKDEILYSMRQCNCRHFRSRPFGWKYGVNRSVTISGKERIRQYAYDFYGHKEIVKEI